MIEALWVFIKGIDSRIWLALAVALLVGGVWLHGDANGYGRRSEEVNAEKLETINENIRIKEDAENIPLPSDIDYINRLRSKTL